MKLAIVVLTFLALATASPILQKKMKLPSRANGNFKGNEEDSMFTDEIIRNRGYPAEVHYVTTEDGYIIQIQRIPYGLQSGPASGKPVVYLQHGLLSASTDWVMGSVNKALGYMLADAGYDVWLGNVRGNTYGRNHTTLDPDTNSTFWEFSFDQIGQYDVPANLEYILRVTGQNQLSYVGHSQGTLTFWIAMETRPELNRKINMMFALAPVATVAHMLSPIRLIAPYADSLEWILSNLGVNEFLPSSDLFQLVGEEACKQNSTLLDVCVNILFLLCGPDSEQLDTSMIPLIVSHTPAGTSVRNVVHFAQLYNHAYYAHYDYGLFGNIANYGQQNPPKYNLATTTAPVTVFWGLNDWLAVPEDVEWLTSQLPNLRQSFLVDQFNHLDFLWAIEVDRYVNSRILDILANL